jgi:hypothetical protein
LATDTVIQLAGAALFVVQRAKWFATLLVKQETVVAGEAQ